MTFITHNLHLKIFAFIAAVALWFFVVGIENTVYRFPQDIPVHPMNLPQNLSIASDLGKAKIVIRTGAEDYKRVTQNDFDLYIDLKNYNAGDYVVPLAADVKNEKVTLLRIEPPTIPVKLEPITSKEVKIKTITAGNPLPGYHLKDMKLSQDTATITGAQSVIQNIQSVNAQIDFNGTQNADFKVTVALTFDPKLFSPNSPNVSNITIEPQQVSADVKLEAELEQKTVLIKPKIFGETDASAQNQLEIDPVAVKIRGPQDILNKINVLETESILPARLKNQPKPFKIGLVLPTNVTLADGEPRSVTVTVKESSSGQ